MIFLNFQQKNEPYYVIYLKTNKIEQISKIVEN